jgi:hypothetical protein
MKLGPYLLTVIAEDLGRRSPPALRWLALLARHASPLVREGVVYGLAPHVAVPGVRILLEVMADADRNTRVRDAAREALEP